MFPDKRAMCDNLVYIAEDLFLFEKTNKIWNDFP